MMSLEYKSPQELYAEALAEARALSAREIRTTLNQRLALHAWGVCAYEDALLEKQRPIRELKENK